MKKINCEQNAEHSSCNKIDKKYILATEVYVDDKVCPDVWEIKEPINKTGAYGDIIEACCEKTCDYVYKEIKFQEKNYPQYTLDDLKNEIHFQELASNAGLAPKIYQVFISKDKGAFIMDRMEYTIAEFINTNYDDKKLLDKTLDDIVTEIKSLNKIGIVHDDLHLGNIMYSSKDSVWKFIDFGKAREMKENDGEAYDEEYFLYNFKKHIHR